MAAMAEDLQFTAFELKEAGELAGWLTSEPWPFHARQLWAVEDALAAINDGQFTEENRTFWVALPRQGRVGLLRFRYLADVSPDVDVRLLAPFRGRGFGTRMVMWAAEHLFTTTEKHRLAGETRVDNIAMRNVFRRCGWVKEAHYRRSWPDGDGDWVDSIGYAILRGDWISGRTTKISWDEKSEVPS
jgi:RimJ/RimL family protein N-acetyltransferase